jgi:hypothetical protein
MKSRKNVLILKSVALIKIDTEEMKINNLKILFKTCRFFYSLKEKLKKERLLSMMSNIKFYF